MGFLHEGHLSLMRKARELADRVVVSIYVNPAQFAPEEDLNQYPRDMEKDLDLCIKEHVDVVFNPETTSIYPRDFKTYVITEDISKVLCGVSRPKHFRGVTTICCKLFNIIKPHVAVFGQKDAQQAIIIKRMVADLNMDIEIIVQPIIRESDGLAMSSRNKYLNPRERAEATVLFKSLQFAKEAFDQRKLTLEEMKTQMLQFIKRHSSGKIDYIEFVDAQNLNTAQPEQSDTLAALAVFFGSTRLIDNIIIPKREQK
jgi:pantoate--beta-alanine ligase